MVASEQCMWGVVRRVMYWLLTCVLYFSAMVNGKFDPHFPLQHQQKDLRLVLGLGDRVEQPLYVASAANEVTNSVLCGITLMLQIW